AGAESGPQVAAGRSASGRTSSARGGVAAIVGAADPLTLTLITPLVSDGPSVGPSGDGESAGPAIRSEREETPGRRTLADAADDVGGTGDLPSPDPGIPQRIARRQADPLRLTPGRYANRSEGGA